VHTGKHLKALCTHCDNTGAWEDVTHYLDNNSQELFAAAEQLKSNVHFVGRLNHDQLKFLFPIADLAVFPSVVPEAYPLVLMESLSNGVLPVVSYFSGFTDGERISALADNILHILASDSFKTIRPTLRQVACERYDWNLRATQMIDAYQFMIDKRDAKRRKVA